MPHRGIDNWTAAATFDGIKAFQQDNGLKVDGFMRPGGPTERAMNASLIDSENKPGLGEGETPPLGSGKGGIRLPGNNMPVFTEDLPSWCPGAIVDGNGKPVLSGPHPNQGVFSHSPTQESLMIIASFRDPARGVCVGKYWRS